ncbi:MAG: HAD hydrolase-like protein [Pirellulaceae bacterium]
MRCHFEVLCLVSGLSVSAPSSGRAHVQSLLTLEIVVTTARMVKQKGHRTLLRRVLKPSLPGVIGGIFNLAGRVSPADNVGNRFSATWRFGAMATSRDTTSRERLDLGLVVFDITGTVITNTAAVADALLTALQANGLQIDPEELHPWRGASKRLAIRRLMERHASSAPAEERVEKIYADFHDRLRRQFEAEGLNVIAGVEETFAWLRSGGIQLAFNTGFDRDLADMILHTLKWEQGMVDAVVSGDEVAQGRPAPFMIFRAMEKVGIVNVRQVAVVGDTTLDLEAGWNAGVGQIIGVLSGAHDLERLSQAPHTTSSGVWLTCHNCGSVRVDRLVGRQIAKRNCRVVNLSPSS